jgi:hypothetical protein
VAIGSCHAARPQPPDELIDPVIAREALSQTPVRIAANPLSLNQSIYNQTCPQIPPTDLMARHRSGTHWR